MSGSFAEVVRPSTASPLSCQLVAPAWALPVLRGLGEQLPTAVRPVPTPDGRYALAVGQVGPETAMVRVDSSDATVVQGRHGGWEWIAHGDAAAELRPVLAALGASLSIAHGDLAAGKALIDGLAAAQQRMALALVAPGLVPNVAAERVLALLMSGSGDCGGIRRLLALGPESAAGGPLEQLLGFARRRGYEPPVLAEIAAALSAEPRDRAATSSGELDLTGRPPASVGFIGLGAMGAALASALIDRGVGVVGWDKDVGRLGESVSRGVEPAATLNELVVRCETILTCLPVSADLADVAHGLIRTSPEPRRIIDLTTGDPELTRSVGRELSEHGHELIDAAISGGIIGARTGTMALFVGGAQGSVEACAGTLAALSPTGVQYAGPLGSGQTVKLLNNYVAGVGRVLLSEAVAVALLAGWSAAEFVTACDRSWAHSHHSAVTFPSCVLSDQDTQHFRLALMLKDLRLGRDLAAAGSLALPGVEAAIATYGRAAELHGADADVNAVVSVVCTEAGTTIDANQTTATTPDAVGR
jgi:3-hydroxyisobutyrate dehydrogenase